MAKVCIFLREAYLLRFVVDFVMVGRIGRGAKELARVQKLRSRICRDLLLWRAEANLTPPSWPSLFQCKKRTSRVSFLVSISAIA